MQLFISRINEDPFYVLSWMLVIIFSLCIHEFAHAWMALRKGDDTAAEAGHLSLNPQVQMGWNSQLMLALFGIAWGAVPVDVSRLRNRLDSAWVSLAGPLANLALAALFSALLVGLSLVPGERMSLALEFCKLAAMANGVLFVFNLLPIPMFDGWAICSTFFPSLQRLEASHLQSVSWIFLALVWMTPVGALIWQVGSRLALAMIMGWAHVANLVV